MLSYGSIFNVVRELQNVVKILYLNFTHKFCIQFLKSVLKIPRDCKCFLIENGAAHIKHLTIPPIFEIINQSA